MLFRSVAACALACALGVVTLTELPGGRLSAAEQGIRDLTPDQIAAMFADELAQADAERGDVRGRAERLAAVLKIHGDQAARLVAAFEAEAVKADARGDEVTSEKLNKMADVVKAHFESEVQVASSDLGNTVSLVRTAGSIMYFGLMKIDPDDGSAPEQPVSTVDWSLCPQVDFETVADMAARRGLDPLPVVDAWGHSLEYCLAIESEDGDHRLGVRSAGADGIFQGPVYEIGSFAPSDTASDVVWIDGYFATWPQS